MKTWSSWSLGRIVNLSEVARYSDDDVVARDNGESFVIYEPPAYKGWLVKRYKPESKIDHQVLRKLIELPKTMTSAELALVDRSIAWPVARVVEGYRTVGTIMAKAKPEFFYDMELIGGRVRRQVVEVDHLANTADFFRVRNLPEPSTEGRLNAMRNLVACAALFEKYDIVYADWSFANAFWSPRTQNTLVIDVDASGIGQRQFVETPNWEDPLMRQGRPVTVHTDRYKVALLVTRAVTGQRRDSGTALAEMRRLCPHHVQLIRLLQQALNTDDINLRPTLAELHRAIENSTKPAATAAQMDGHNVTGRRSWRPPVAPSKLRTSPSADPHGPAGRPDPPTHPDETMEAHQSLTTRPEAHLPKPSPPRVPVSLLLVSFVIILVLVVVVVYGA